MTRVTAGEWEILGEHQGLPLYTIGQRSGIGLAGGPWYVLGFDKKKNYLIVTKDQKKSALFAKSLLFSNVSWVSSIPKLPLKCEAQIRYRSRAEKCVIKKSGKNFSAEFLKPQRAIAGGQSIVLYDKDEVIGGGIIM